MFRAFVCHAVSFFFFKAEGRSNIFLLKGLDSLILHKYIGFTSKFACVRTPISFLYQGLQVVKINRGATVFSMFHLFLLQYRFFFSAHRDGGEVQYFCFKASLLCRIRESRSIIHYWWKLSKERWKSLIIFSCRMQFFLQGSNQIVQATWARALSNKNLTK